jgi:hypothetical protein
VKRPANSRLSNAKLRETLGLVLEPWEHTKIMLNHGQMYYRELDYWRWLMGGAERSAARHLDAVPPHRPQAPDADSLLERRPDHDGR